MQLSIAPKFVARQQAPSQSATETALSASTRTQKSKPSSLYAVAVVVRLGVLGALLFHALAFGPW